MKAKVAVPSPADACEQESQGLSRHIMPMQFPSGRFDNDDDSDSVGTTAAAIGATATQPPSLRGPADAFDIHS